MMATTAATTSASRPKRIAVSLVLFLPVLCPRSFAQAGPGQVAEVSVIEVKPETVSLTRDIVGSVDASENVEIRGRVEGFLQEKLFKDGAEVKKGDRLFKIDPLTYEATLGEAKAQLAQAEASLESAKTSVDVLKAKADHAKNQAALTNAQISLSRETQLLKAKAISQQELDDATAQERQAAALADSTQALVQQAEINQKTEIKVAEAAIQSANAAVVKAQINLGYTDVFSPISGRIGKAEMDVGSLVGKGQDSLLARVSSLTPIYVTFSISERDYLTLAKQVDPKDPAGGKIPGLTIQLLMADDTLFDQQGEITFIDRAVDPKTGTIALRAEFANPKGILRPGQYGKLRITGRSPSQRLLVPQRAVREVQGAQFVYLVSAEGMVEERPIKTGERIDTQWVVNQGLNAGDRVIVEGGQKVRPGMRVRAVPAPAQ